jgi:hypothetical protein
MQLHVVQTTSPTQLGQLEHHANTGDNASRPSQQPRCCVNRTSRCEHVVENEHAASVWHMDGLNFQGSITVFKGIVLRENGARQLSGLAYRQNTRARAIGHSRGEEETTGLNTSDGIEATGEPIAEGIHNRAETLRISQHGSEVPEHDARLREVGNCRQQ